MESSPPLHAKLTPFAGMKRPAPSLLPPLDPFSSPGLPRTKWMALADDDRKFSDYPSPIPTSSTFLLSSSPPKQRIPKRRRGVLNRSESTASERAPLSTVPSIQLSESGKVMRLGRSSLSCDYQLSANQLISRVHVQAAYKPADSALGREERIEISCVGWNGITLHCQGRTYELGKGKTFTSTATDADIMIDVHDARALIRWPQLPEKREPSSDAERGRASVDGEGSDADDGDENEGTGQVTPKNVVGYDEDEGEAEGGGGGNGGDTPPRATKSSPPAASRLSSPARAKSPYEKISRQAIADPVFVYEDARSSPTPTKKPPSKGNDDQDALAATLRVKDDDEVSDGGDEENEENEENEDDENDDQLIHSFAPFDDPDDSSLPYMENLSTIRLNSSKSRASLTAIRDLEVEEPRTELAEPKPEADKEENGEGEGEDEITAEYDKEGIRNHAVNQLAYSRLNSTPLSTVLSNLPFPKEFWSKFPHVKKEIEELIKSTECIGAVDREGKDAAGKPLESEFYYVAELDSDEMRRSAVSAMKPGLRNCRKQHRVSSSYLSLSARQRKDEKLTSRSSNISGESQGELVPSRQHPAFPIPLGLRFVLSFPFPFPMFVAVPSPFLYHHHFCIAIIHAFQDFLPCFSSLLCHICSLNSTIKRTIKTFPHDNHQTTHIFNYFSAINYVAVWSHSWAMVNMTGLRLLADGCGLAGYVQGIYYS